MLLLTVLLVVAQAPGRGKAPAPRGPAAVRAAFVQGDLPRATELARACARREPAVCRPLLTRLGQYAPLARAVDRLTLPEARRFLEMDRAISPGAPGALTAKAIEKFVTAPLELARHHAQEGNDASARVIARQVLEVDPQNAEAQALGAPAAPAPPVPRR